MHIEGTIKSMRAAMSAGMADVSQIIQLEVYGEDNWREIRNLMRKPLKITIEASQMTFGETQPGAVDTTATNGKRGRKKKEAVAV